MKKFLCLLIILALCATALYIFRDEVSEFVAPFVERFKSENDVPDAPNADDVGKKGNSETTKVESTVDQNGPNEQLPGWTTRN